MTGRHEAGTATRPVALDDCHEDRAEAATKALVASAGEIGRTLARVAEARRSDMNVDDVLGPAGQLGTASAEARALARASAQGR